MRLPRYTIARSLGLTAIVALNAAVVRAFVVHEQFCGIVLLIMVLSVGFGCLPRSRGRARRFWWGFIAGGLFSVGALYLCEFFPDSPWDRLVFSYSMAAMNGFFRYAPDMLVDFVDEDQDRLLAVVFFLPEFAAALIGGAIAARWGSGGDSIPEGVTPRDEPVAVVG